LNTSVFYTPRLNAGLGIIPETVRLLELWQPDLTPKQLFEIALNVGAFPAMSARRLRNMVLEGFAPRFLVNEAQPARMLKALHSHVDSADFCFFLLIYTCRANAILGDFIRTVYWQKYEVGQDHLFKKDAQEFVYRAVADGKTRKRWSESTIHRVSQYLLGACADFGLVGAMHGEGRTMRPVRISSVVATFLAHDLHFSGLGDNAVVQHSDWMLFGLNSNETLTELQRLAKKNYFIVQTGGGTVQFAWKYENIGDFVNGLIAKEF